MIMSAVVAPAGGGFKTSMEVPVLPSFAILKSEPAYCPSRTSEAFEVI
jgi:hypothetical protein